MKFIDNWCYALAAPFAIGAATLPVPPDAITRLNLAAGDEYVLTIVSVLDPLSIPALEIIRITGAAGGYTLARGEEGTAEQAWPSGAVIMCALTAATLQALADAGGGGGSDDTVIEHITTDVHRNFFGKPLTAPLRLGQLCRQIDPNGLVCEWVAYMSWDDSLQWRRSLLPMADWGVSVPETFTDTLLETDRAFAMTQSFSATPITSTLALPDTVTAGGLNQFPLVIANWSDQPWTVNLDPSAFWVTGGTAFLDANGFAALGITSDVDAAGMASIVLPANTRAWLDITVAGGDDGSGFAMSYEIYARALTIYQN